MGERNYRNNGQNRRPASAANKGSGRGVMVGVLIGLVVGISVAVGLAMYLNRSTTPFSNMEKFTERNKEASGNVAPEELAPGTQIVDASQVASSNLPPLTEINARAEAQASAAAQERDQAAAKAAEPEFDFYKILPGQADAVPGADPAAKSRDVAASSASKNTYLQLGSFQNEKEADNLKAKLALLGVEAKIQSVELADKGLVHRVRVGPFSNSDDMERMRAQLQQNGIDAASAK